MKYRKGDDMSKTEKKQVIVSLVFVLGLIGLGLLLARILIALTK